MIKVSYIKSDNRTYNIERSLSLLKSEIVSGLRSARKIVIKPNCVSDNVQLASTHVDAIRAVLDFISPFTKGQIVLAEGTKFSDTLTAFRNFGYLEIQDQYDLAIVDLNDDKTKEITLFDLAGESWQAPIPKTLLESDYIISIAPAKTNEKFLFDGATKNLMLDSFIFREPKTSLLSNFSFKKLMGPKTNNCNGTTAKRLKTAAVNIIRLLDTLSFKLAIIDGFEAMEGDGPVEGKMVPSQFAVASATPLAADWLTCQLMGINPEMIGYLLQNASNDPRNYFIIGDEWKKDIISFRLPESFSKLDR